MIAGDPPFLTGTDPCNQSSILRPFSTMDIDQAAANHVNRLEQISRNELAIQLPILFEKLLDPDLEPRLVYSYVVSAHQ